MAMMARQFSSKQFTYRAESKTFSTFRSDLGIKADQVFGQLYADACDEGILIRSEKTGKIAAYALHHTEIDADGDTQFWEFQAVRQHHEMGQGGGQFAPFSTYENTKVIVFNT